MKATIAAFILLMAGLASAQNPSISGVSGTVEDGQSVTITGTNFGSRTIKPGSFFESWEHGSSLIGGDIPPAWGGDE